MIVICVLFTTDEFVKMFRNRTGYQIVEPAHMVRIQFLICFLLFSQLNPSFFYNFTHSRSCYLMFLKFFSISIFFLSWF